MSADTAMLPAARRPRIAALHRLTRTELTLFLRERAGVIWGIGLPLILLIIFGNNPGFRKPVSRAVPGVSILDSYVPVLLAFVLAMIALNVLPPVLAGYREKGVLRRLSATPVGAVRVLAAQLGAAVQAMTNAWQGNWHPLYPLILAGYMLAFAVAAAKFFRWE